MVFLDCPAAPMPRFSRPFRNMTREVCPGAYEDGKPVEEADSGYESEKDGDGEDEYSGGESGD